MWLTSFTALMDSLPLETTDWVLASTTVLGDSPPCKDALYENISCFLLKADIWKVFKDPAPIFIHLKINATSTQQTYQPVFEKLNTSYPLADKVHTLSLGEKKCTRRNNSNMAMTGVNRTCTFLSEADPGSKHPTALLVVCYWSFHCKFQPCPSIPSLSSLHTYLWKRWPQGSLRADCMESQQMAQSSLFTASSSGVATANLQRKKQEETEGMTTQAQHGLLSREPSTEKTLPSTLTFHWKIYANRFIIFLIAQATLQRNTHIHILLIFFAGTDFCTSPYTS